MNPSPVAATYRGDDGTFLRTGGWALLLDVRPEHPLVEGCWDRLGATADLDDVLETIVAQGLRTAPAFALVRETGVRRVVARGAQVLLLDGTDALRDRHAGTWVDLPLTDVSMVEASLSGTEPAGAALPLRDGASAATGFRLVLDDARSPTNDPRLPADDAHPPAATPDAGHLLADTLPPARAVDAPAAPPAPAAPAAEAAMATAVVALPIAAPTAAPTAVPTSALPKTPAAAASSEETLPGGSTTGSAPAADPRPAGRDMFVSRQQLMRGDDAIAVPRVLAAVCPAGHLTPAYSGICRVCRRVVAAQEAFETARPALGRLVLPQGDALLLDRGAVLGRAPHVPEDWAGAQPHLVALHDPDHDVSAQHVSVVLDLWNVLVSDLGSTNGTALVDQDGRVTPLRPHEPAALRPGGAVVLADVITLQFEVHP